jgi:hypothetical protein
MHNTHELNDLPAQAEELHGHAVALATATARRRAALPPPQKRIQARFQEELLARPRGSRGGAAEPRGAAYAG